MTYIWEVEINGEWFRVDGCKPSTATYRAVNSYWHLCRNGEIDADPNIMEVRMHLVRTGKYLRSSCPTGIRWGRITDEKKKGIC